MRPGRLPGGEPGDTNRILGILRKFGTHGMLAEYSEYSKNFGILTPGQLGILNLLRKLGTLRIFRILGKLGILRILGIKTMKCQ